MASTSSSATPPAVFNHSEIHAKRPRLPHRPIPHRARPTHRLRHPQQPSHQQHRGCPTSRLWDGGFHHCRSKIHRRPHTTHTRPRPPLAPLLPRHLYQHRTPRRPQPPQAGTTGTIPPTKRPPTTPNPTLHRPRSDNKRKSIHPSSLVPSTNPSRSEAILACIFPERLRSLDPRSRSRQTPLNRL